VRMASDGNKATCEIYSLLENVGDGFPSNLASPGYIVPEAGSSSWSPNKGSNPDGLFSDYNVDMDQHYVDANNNNQFCKKEVTLDNSFEDMINDTYESMMQTQKGTPTSVSQPPPDFPPSQGPIARSSPKVKKFKHIHPKPQQAGSGILVQVPPNSSRLPSQKVTKIPHPSPVKMITMHSFLSRSALSEPRSYTWRGLLGGLQRNKAVKQREAASSSSLVTWPTPLTVSQPGRKLMPKPTLSINQPLFKRLVSVRPNNRVSLLKSVPTRINKDLSTFQLDHHLDLSSLDLSPVKHTVYKPKTIKLKVVKEEKLPVISPSGWVTREDPSRMKKNEVERERRLEMAIYRENLRKMLPRTKHTVKVPSVVILDAAKEYCEKIQTELHELELVKLEEERRQEILTWRLARIKCQLKT